MFNIILLYEIIDIILVYYSKLFDDNIFWTFGTLTLLFIIITFYLPRKYKYYIILFQKLEKLFMVYYISVYLKRTIPEFASKTLLKMLMVTLHYLLYIFI